MNAKDIIAEIDQYVSLPATPFAFLLEGPWGCGKTRFVDCELSPELRKRGISVLRVSMIGVTSAKEVYERILAASVRDASGINGTAGRNRFDAGRNAAKELGFSYLKQKFKKALGAVDLVYSPAPELLVGVVLDKKTLVVLDDSERIGKMDPLEFFGAVDGLLERLGRKVLIVHGTEGEPLEEDIAEKLIMKTCELTPDYECVCKSVFEEAIGACPSLRVNLVLADGVKASGVLNVRMLIRVKPYVTKLFESAYANDESVDESIRHRTLADAVEHVVRSIAGTLPTEPSAPPEGADLGEAFGYQRRRDIWDRSNALRHLDSLVKVGVLDDRDLSECLRDYGTVYYPSSALEEDALKLAEEVKYCCMDDEEADRAGGAILRAFGEGDVCIGNVPRLVAALAYLKDWKIISADEWEGAIEGARKILLKDPLESARIVHSYEYDWHDIKLRFGRDIPELDSIVVDVSNKSSRIMEEEAKEALGSCDEHGPEVLATKLRAMGERNPGSFVDLDSTYFAAVVLAGSARSISVFREWVLSLKSDYRLTEGKKVQVAEWLRAVDGSLDIDKASGKMSRVQVCYLKKNLDDVADSLSGEVVNA